MIDVDTYHISRWRCHTAQTHTQLFAQKHVWVLVTLCFDIEFLHNLLLHFFPMEKVWSWTSPETGFVGCFKPMKRGDVSGLGADQWEEARRMKRWNWKHDELHQPYTQEELTAGTQTSPNWKEKSSSKPPIFGSHVNCNLKNWDPGRKYRMLTTGQKPCDIGGAIWSQGWCNFPTKWGARELQNPQNHRVVGRLGRFFSHFSYLGGLFVARSHLGPPWVSTCFPRNYTQKV